VVRGYLQYAQQNPGVLDQYRKGATNQATQMPNMGGSNAVVNIPAMNWAQAAPAQYFDGKVSYPDAPTFNINQSYMPAPQQPAMGASMQLYGALRQPGTGGGAGPSGGNSMYSQLAYQMEGAELQRQRLNEQYLKNSFPGVAYQNTSHYLQGKLLSDRWGQIADQTRGMYQLDKPGGVINSGFPQIYQPQWVLDSMNSGRYWQDYGPGITAGLFTTSGGGGAGGYEDDSSYIWIDPDGSTPQMQGPLAPNASEYGKALGGTGYVGTSGANNYNGSFIGPIPPTMSATGHIIGSGGGGAAPYTPQAPAPAGGGSGWIEMGGPLVPQYDPSGPMPPQYGNNMPKYLPNGFIQYPDGYQRGPQYIYSPPGPTFMGSYNPES
jgi:hypothetical protein